jgi:hypothetical protein
MEKTKIGISEFTSPDGKKKVKAKVWKMQSDSTKILAFEKKFYELQNNLKKQMKITDKKSGNALEHWILSDLLITFYNYAEKEGFDLRENTKPLVAYIGKTESYWMLHKKFKKIYPSKELINPSIPWKMYLYLIRVEDDIKRKILENMILHGELTNQQELRRIKDYSIEELKKKIRKPVKNLPLQNQRIVDALQKKDLSREELAIAIGLPPTKVSFGTIRGRISDNNKRFGCNIYKVGDRYHLETNEHHANKVTRKSHPPKNTS